MDIFTGVCKEGPYDGDTMDRQQNEITVYQPMLEFAFNIKGAKVIPIPLGNYIHVEGCWMWSPAS